ncbi:hypothetical protein WN51_12559 [Melipona quadrifasciata]|uniref:Uncharacterized protein n=1 Tax=Melipona quadrifasciata TaxID=166423 RepID=A0A0N0U5S4_9HYME|nr:hypothetical protein WN51_12559 [Melipona quadrifasciata]
MRCIRTYLDNVLSIELLKNLLANDMEPITIEFSSQALWDNIELLNEVNKFSIHCSDKGTAHKVPRYRKAGNQCYTMLRQC